MNRLTPAARRRRSLTIARAANDTARLAVSKMVKYRDEPELSAEDWRYVSRRADLIAKQWALISKAAREWARELDNEWTTNS